MLSTFLHLTYSFVNKIATKLNFFVCTYSCEVEKEVIFHPTAKILNAQKDKSKIRIGSKSHIRGEIFLFKHGGNVNIGKHCYIGEGTKISSSCDVSIGNHVLIAHNVNIIDSNSHPMNFLERREHFMEIITLGHSEKLNLNEKNVKICSDVWIGFNAVIMKGVTIGEGAIVAACSVVTKDVPPFSVVAGNPAKVIKYLDKNETKADYISNDL
jgi:acetyltransferase-like isoleucine patch superfamily enzyme